MLSPTLMLKFMHLTAAAPAMDVVAPVWSLRLVQIVSDAGFVVIAAGILLSLFRMVRGPRLADRAVALDTIAVHLVAMVVLFTLQLDSLVLYDGVLVLSLLGFAGTVAVAQFILRPHLRGRQRTWRTVAATSGADQAPDVTGGSGTNPDGAGVEPP